MAEAKLIDLRSDTVTRPTPQMRAAMASAEVGDDVYGEDPSLNRLEQRAAEAMGKEAALFVPTGTMGNTIGIKIHTGHGDEVLCEAHSHVLDWEHSMMAWFAGCVARAVAAPGGILTWPAIAGALRQGGPNNAHTSLITLEDTHNMAGGTVYPQAAIDEICEEAHRRGLKVHIDGARIFNAATASGVPASRIARDADSVMFCLSKGLCAPVGSMLAGTGEAIARARIHRKRLGGGMRQAGVLAAAGLIALEQMTLRLAEDHANAKLLAEGVARLPCIDFDPSHVQTNIVIFDTLPLSVTTGQFSDALKDRGILANGVDHRRMRLVTHHDVTRADCEAAVEVIGESVSAFA